MNFCRFNVPDHCTTLHHAAPRCTTLHHVAFHFKYQMTETLRDLMFLKII